MPWFFVVTRFRHGERRPESSVEHFTGFVVPRYAFCRTVKVDGAAQTVRNIRQVHQQRGLVAFLDRSIQVLLLVGDHRVDKIGKVVSLTVCLRPGFMVWTQPGLVGIVALDGQITFGAVEDISNRAGRVFAAACRPDRLPERRRS